MDIMDVDLLTSVGKHVDKLLELPKLCGTY